MLLRAPPQLCTLSFAVQLVLQVKKLPEASLLPSLPKTAKVVRPLEGNVPPLRPTAFSHHLARAYSSLTSPAVIKEQSRVLLVFPLCECNLLHLLQQVPAPCTAHTPSHCAAAQKQRQESGRTRAAVPHVPALPATFVTRA